VRVAIDRVAVVVVITAPVGKDPFVPPPTLDAVVSAPPPPSSPRRRRSALFGGSVGVLCTLGVVGGIAVVGWNQGAVRRAIARAAVGHEPGDDPNEHRWPGRRDFTLRATLMDDRDRAVAHGDLERAASVNGRLAQEALLRAAACQRAWVGRQDPATKLFPQSAANPVWRYRDFPADCFGFLIQAGLRLTPDTLGALNETLAAEARLAPPGALPHGHVARTGAPLDEPADTRMFGATEYVKDGLLSVFERYGDDPRAAPARDRLFQVMDLILANAAHPSPFGNLPGRGAEENGNCLQAFSRLSFAAPAGKGDAYAEFAARIADAYVGQVLPRTNGLPAKQFDFGADKVDSPSVQLRDHGNEAVPGLSEAYAMAVARAGGSGPPPAAWRARADRWAEPLCAMYETLFARATGADGMLAAALDGRTLAVTAAGPNDNWAYLLNGALLYAQAARRHAAAGGAVAGGGAVTSGRLAAIEAACDRAIGAVAGRYGVAWEKDSIDGYADALEGAMYMMHHRPGAAAALGPWVDREIGPMFARQVEGGTVRGDYLDGNFIRTALMYADLRAGGWAADPWRDDVRVGFAADPATGEAVLSVRTGGRPYAGVVRPDRARHRDVMKLPWDWPRLNHWPEHFVPGPGARAVGAAGTPTPTADQLTAGIPVDLPADARATVRLRVGPPAGR
jgi:hypothetical protein